MFDWIVFQISTGARKSPLPDWKKSWNFQSSASSTSDCGTFDDNLANFLEILGTKTKIILMHFHSSWKCFMWYQENKMGEKTKFGRFSFFLVFFFNYFKSPSPRLYTTKFPSLFFSKISRHFLLIAGKQQQNSASETRPTIYHVIMIMGNN
jgi:hypothetical protein